VQGLIITPMLSTCLVVTNMQRAQSVLVIGANFASSRRLLVVTPLETDASALLECRMSRTRRAARVNVSRLATTGDDFVFRLPVRHLPRFTRLPLRWQQAHTLPQEALQTI
jgi:hypothetical protein